jgi:hypothetical protein
MGLFSAVQSSGIQRFATIAVSIFAVLIGLWNIKDFFWRKRRLRLITGVAMFALGVMLIIFLLLGIL